MCEELIVEEYEDIGTIVAKGQLGETLKAYYNACKAKKQQWEYIRNWEVFLDLPILDKQELPLCYKCLTKGHSAHACRLPFT